jgi:hypothetical protein
MNKWLGLPLLLLAICTLSNTALAFDCSTKIELPARPEMSKYNDYDLFVADIVKYKNTKRQQLMQHHQCPDLYATTIIPASPPQTLNQAIQAAANTPGNAGSILQNLEAAAFGGGGNSGSNGSGNGGFGSGGTNSSGTSGSQPSFLDASQLAFVSIFAPLTFLNGDSEPQSLPALPFDVIQSLDSGDPTSELLKDYLKRQLPQQDQDSANVYQIATNGYNMVASIQKAGALYIVMNIDGTIIASHETVRTESCLSSGSASGCTWNSLGQLVVPGLSP